MELGDDDIFGKRLLDLLPVGSRVFYETHFAPLLRMQGYFHEVALDFMRHDRTRLPVLANATQKVAADGEVLETRVAVFQAISRRKYERELYEATQDGIRAREEAETLNIALTEAGLLREEFIAVLGHDLRNPLASIGSGMRILSKEALSPRGRQVIDLAEGSVARMGRGFAVTRAREDQLAHVLEHVVAELAAASGRTIDVTIDLPEASFVDSGRIGQLASNLVGNALSHGAEDRPVGLAAGIKDGELIISVSNEGDPIPPETQTRLFQPFFRGGVTGNNAQGLGLGLHIASEIAKAHGGSLSVTSTAEITMFELRMPNDSVRD